MKKFKRIFLFIFSFCFLLLNVNAASSSCDYNVGYVKKGGSINITDQTYNDELVLEEGELVHSYQEYASLLHNTGWNTYAYKCTYSGGSCSTVNTGCKFDSATVATWQCYKSIASTCSYTYSGLKGYAWSGSGPCTSRVPVPCEEPPAILCEVSCTINKCPRPTCHAYGCSDGSGSAMNVCKANGGNWICTSPGTVYDATQSGDYGGGDSDTITTAEGETKIKADYPDCKGTAVCTPKTYRSEYLSCSPAQCGRTAFEVKGAHDFVYAVDTKSGGPKVTAYCANPSHNPLIEQSAWAERIEVLKCAASDSSLDCGVANILSEAFYRNSKISGESGKYNNHVVSLAIRLWYAYKERSGFNSMGIAEEDETTIDSLDDFLAYIPGPDGTFPNVYKKTLDGIRREIFFQNFQSATGNDYDFNGVNIGNLKGIACSSSNMGVYCNGSSGNTYIYAAYLFINTVQGNPYMKEHFLAIFEDSITDLEGDELVEEISKKYNDPIYYQVSLSDDGKTATINYELRSTVDISCNDLNVEGCDAPDQKLIFKDASGNIIDQVLIEKYDYCNKNYCTSYVELEYPILECDQVKSTELKFTGKKICGEDAIYRYTPCAGLDDYQIMYSLDTYCSTNVSEEKTLTSTLECPGGCEEETLPTSPSNCTDIYRYDAQNYNNGNERENGSGYYYQSGIDPEKQVGVKYEFTSDYLKETVSDPSLTCILNKRSSTRSYYDYSTYFGVDTNFCRVYCSDSVEYYLPPRKTVSNALQVTYDVIPGTKYNDNHLFTVVKTKRNCVSKIFYDDFSFTGASVDWAAAYGLDSGTEINNWKELYNAVYEVSKTQGDTKDFLHNLVYDLYNCNFFTEQQIKDANVIIPSDAGKNSRTYVSEYLSNTQSYCNSNNCTSGATKFQGGAEYIEHVTDDGNTITHVGGDYIKTGHPNLSNNTSVKGSVTFKYCKTTDQCFVENSDAEKPYEDRFESKAKSSSYKEGIAGLSNVQIPTNDYVIFSYELDGSIYNSTSYQVEPQTGKVQVYKQSDSTKYNKISKNTLPLSYYSDALCDDRVCKIDVNVYNNIYSKYNKSIDKNVSVNAFYRKDSDDALINAVMKFENYTCDILVPIGPPQTPMGFVFRNIELSAPVPTTDGMRGGSVFENSNWDLSNTADGDYNSHLQNVINQIKNSSEDLYGRDQYLEYSYILDDNAIRSIREYNDVNRDYASITDSSGAKTLDNCVKEDGKYFDCKSKFVEQLNNYGVNVIKGDGVSKFSECKENPSGEGCND